MVTLTRDARTDLGERISFPSSDPFEFTQILDGSAPASEVFGDLELPEGEGPFPCIVAIHGSYGWRSHHLDYCDMYREMGIATFRIHSFEARGTREVSKTQIEVTLAMMIADAYAALAMLAKRPEIDGSRVALTGWSLGGSMALYGAWEPLIEKLSPAGPRFAAHLGIYPSAHLIPEDCRWTKAPILSMTGDAEDYTPAPPVREQTDEINAHGGNAELILYPGCYHSFDSTDEVEYLPDVISMPPERLVTIKKDGRMLTRTGKDVSTRDGRLDGFAKAVQFGAHIGGNPEMRKKAFADAKAFMQKTLLD